MKHLIKKSIKYKHFIKMLHVGSLPKTPSLKISRLFIFSKTHQCNELICTESAVFEFTLPN